MGPGLPGSYPPRILKDRAFWFPKILEPRPSCNQTCFRAIAKLRNTPESLLARPPPCPASRFPGPPAGSRDQSMCRFWQTSEECAASPIHFSQSHQKPVTRQPFSQKLRRDSPKLRSSCPVLLSSAKCEIWGKFFQFPLFQTSSPWSVLNIHM